VYEVPEDGIDMPNIQE